jgi:hypothetical protein
MIIDIPKVGQVEFPDSMSEADVNAAAKRLTKPMLRKKAVLKGSQKSPLEGLCLPLLWQLQARLWVRLLALQGLL